ncbi:MAG: ATP-binding protein [Bacteroidia bacterium]
MKRLPIGIQNFEKIRTENYIYVDKTRHVLNLIQNGGYYFLSRPRRFGKSLLVDTLKCLFEGKKHLFNELYIYQHWDWNQTHPVLHFNLSIFDNSDKSLFINSLSRYIKRIFDKYEISQYFIPDASIKENTYNLIYHIHEKTQKKVVVLIDEYDKPILDNIEKPEYSKEIRDILRGFYEVFKAADEHLQFVFLTGVSKFSKVSIFSGLNNLNDITIDSQFSSILGYTQDEVETYFGKMLDGVDMNKLKWWYNGFNWNGESVYNPFDILLFIDKGKQFQSYWFQTGTPTFLMKILMEKKFFIPEIENITAGEALLSSFDIENIDPLTLLFQTGYLTIKSSLQKGERIEYILNYPNLEVKMAFNDVLLKYYTNKHNETEIYLNKLYDLLYDAKIENIIQLFHSLFSGIPYQWYINNRLNEYEGFFASVFYSVFQSLGITVIPEDTTNKGRIDLTVIINNNIFIFEFKTSDESDNNIYPLQQIKNKKYHEKYLHQNKNIYLIGIEFSKKDRNIAKYEYEKIN